MGNGNVPVGSWSGASPIGGSLPGILTGPKRASTNELVLEQPPRGVPAPERTVALSKTAVTGVALRYGLPLHWANYDRDFSIFADGVSPLRLYKDGGEAYTLGLVAPKTAPTVASTTTTNNVVPIASYGGANTLCSTSPPFSLERVASYYLEGSLIERIPSALADTVSNTVACDQYKAIDRTTQDDTGFLDFRPRVSSHETYAQLRLGVPAATPSVDTGHKIHLRLQYTSVGSPTDLNFTVTLRTAAAPGAGTQIATRTYDEADLTASFADYTITLTEEEAALITDYTSLYLYMVNTSSPGTLADYYSVQCSLAYMELPGAGIANGAYTYGYTYGRTSTGAESGLSPEVTLTHSTGGCVCISGIELSDDPTVDQIHVYRTDIAGKAFHRIRTIPNSNDGYYELCAGTDITTTDPNVYADAILDCTQDVDLTDLNAIILDTTRKRVYGAGLPPRGRYLAIYQNRVFTGGALLDAPYSAGAATFTNGSTTVTGTGTYWTDVMVGRAIGVAGTDKTYRVAAVASTTSLTLTASFEESTETDVGYAITDDRDPYALWFSAANFPEDWPVANGINIDAEAEEGITGLAVHLGRLLIFTRSAIFALSGDQTFRLDPVYKGKGCVSGHSIVVQDNLVYFLAEDGFYSFNGQTVEPISSPPPSDGNVLGINGTVGEINSARFSRAVSVWNDKANVVHNFVSTGAGIENELGVIYDLNTGAWSLDDAPSVVSAAQIFDQNNRKVVLVGGVMGDIWQLDIGTSDGVFKGTVVTTVSSAVADRITCTGAAFDTTGQGLFGVPAYLVSKRGEITRLRVLNNNADTLVLAQPLPFLPTSSYYVVVGAIPWIMTTGNVNYGVPHKASILQYIELTFGPETQGQVWVMAGSDFEDLQILSEKANLSDRSGSARVNVRHKAKHIQTKLFSLLPGHDINITMLEHFVANKAAEKGE